MGAAKAALVRGRVCARGIQFDFLRSCASTNSVLGISLQEEFRGRRIETKFE